MALKLPLQFEAEFRGAERNRAAFKDRETGEDVQPPDSIKLEIDYPNGDVDLMVVSASQFERCDPPFNEGALKRGDRLLVTGLAVVQDRQSGRDSYVRFESVTRLGVTPAASAGKQ